MQRIHQLFSALAALATTLASGYAMGAEIKVAFTNQRPPYCFTENNMDQGIEIDLLRQIMALSGHTVKVVIMPKARLLKSVKEKEVDVATTVQNNNLYDNTDLYFSDNYLDFKNFVISKSKDKIEINSLQDLHQYAFIIWQNAWKNLGSEFETMYRPDSNGTFPKNYNEAFNQLSQNKMFWANRAPLIIIDKRIFEHYLPILAKEFDTSIALTYHDIFKIRTPYAVVFHDANLRQQFNEGLKKIRANGDYQKIVDSYK